MIKSKMLIKNSHPNSAAFVRPQLYIQGWLKSLNTQCFLRQNVSSITLPKNCKTLCNVLRLFTICALIQMVKNSTDILRWFTMFGYSLKELTLCLSNILGVFVAKTFKPIDNIVLKKNRYFHLQAEIRGDLGGAERWEYPETILKHHSFDAMV